MRCRIRSRLPGAFYVYVTCYGGGGGGKDSVRPEGQGAEENVHVLFFVCRGKGLAYSSTFAHTERLRKKERCVLVVTRGMKPWSQYVEDSKQVIPRGETCPTPCVATILMSYHTANRPTAVQSSASSYGMLCTGSIQHVRHI